MLLAVYKRLRRIYFWGSTFCLFALLPLVVFGSLLLANRTGTWSSYQPKGFSGHDVNGVYQ